jgi:hypothetical protein
MGSPLLARIPFDERTVIGGDAGRPAMLDAPEGLSAEAFRGLAAQAAAALGLHSLATVPEVHPA